MHKMKSGVGDPILSREKWGTQGQKYTSFELELFFPDQMKRKVDRSGKIAFGKRNKLVENNSSDLPKIFAPRRLLVGKKGSNSKLVHF